MVLMQVTDTVSVQKHHTALYPKNSSIILLFQEEEAKFRARLIHIRQPETKMTLCGRLSAHRSIRTRFGNG